MHKTFTAHREDRPGAAWLARFRAGRDEAARWYLGDTAAPLPPEACRAALVRHMPELVRHYDAACGLVGDDHLATASSAITVRPPTGRAAARRYGSARTARPLCATTTTR